MSEANIEAATCPSSFVSMEARRRLLRDLVSPGVGGSRLTRLTSEDGLRRRGRRDSRETAARALQAAVHA